MSLRIHILGVSVLTIAALLFGGCSSAPEGGEGSGEDGMQMDEGHADHGDMGHDDAGDDQAKIEENLGKLSEADRALAEKQKICPVTENPLGGKMGKPIKLEVEGRELFICCPDCEDAVRKDPDKYLAKVSKEE